LCRPLPRLRLIACLQPPPDLLMPAHAPSRWHALVEGLAIQGVEELVARGHRAIGPGVRPAHPHKLSTACEGRTSLLDVLYTPAHDHGHCGHRKLPPRYAGRFEQRLLLCR